MKRQFSLFQSHIDLAHAYWKQLLKPGDIAIDATCGNGQDTLFLAELGIVSVLYGFDIQEKALANTQERLNALSIGCTIKLEKRSHETFPAEIQPDTVSLIVYNLGFLPGGNKELTTQRDCTLKSIKNAQLLLKAGGLICITCYSGHPEGAQEELALQEYLSSLPPQDWSYGHMFWKNRRQSPSLILLQKAL